MKTISVYAIAALVLLRLLTGWHFYNEGIKKFETNFSSAGFLRTAKGPLAPLFRSMVPGPYGAYAELAAPVELGSRDAETRAAINKWYADYGKQAAAATKAGEPFPAKIAPEVPGAAIVGRMAESWTNGLTRLARLGVEGEVGERLQALREAKLGEVTKYLYDQSDAVEELQHEAWRLEELKQKARGASPPPFQRDRIAAKDGEVWGAMQPIVAGMNQIETSFQEEASLIAADAGLSPARVTASLAERSLLGWVDAAVSYTVLGVGICVFLGLATRVAAIVGAGFLLSLIMTQPPWVAGADMAAFFTWSVELAGFLVLAAMGAGRWAGIDGLLHAVRVRVGDLSPKYAKLREPVVKTPHSPA